jgi:hypothetical protein
MTKGRALWFVVATLIFVAVSVSTFGSYAGIFAPRDLVQVSGKISLVEFQDVAVPKSKERRRIANFWFVGTRGRFVMGLTGRADIEALLANLPDVSFSVPRGAYQDMQEGDSVPVFGLTVTGVSVTSLDHDLKAGRLSLGAAAFLTLSTLAILITCGWPNLRIIWPSAQRSNDGGNP